jgi:hypothetical protein
MSYNAVDMLGSNPDSSQAEEHLTYFGNVLISRIDSSSSCFIQYTQGFSGMGSPPGWTGGLGLRIGCPGCGRKSALL